MSAHPQGAHGHYDDGYGQPQQQQGQDAYYNDDQYGQYHDQHPNQPAGQQGYDNQHNDAYYDESCVHPRSAKPATKLTYPQCLLR